MNSTMFNAGDILETIRMIQDECLDIRTTTMGISLLDCIDPDINKACDKVYDKITRKAEKLVETGEKIEKEYGIPIINKRIAVTPIAMLAAACPKDSPVKFAKALQRAAETCGVNFVGGYSALVHKGFSAGDLELIRSIPEALGCHHQGFALLSMLVLPEAASIWTLSASWVTLYWNPQS